LCLNLEVVGDGGPVEGFLGARVFGDVFPKRLVRSVVIVHFSWDDIDFDIHLDRVAGLVVFDSGRCDKGGIDMAATLAGNLAKRQRQGGGVVELPTEVCAIGANDEAPATARLVMDFRPWESDPPWGGAAEKLFLGPLDPRPASIDSHSSEIGRKAIDFLIARIENRTTPLSPLVLRPKLLGRGAQPLLGQPCRGPQTVRPERVGSPPSRSKKDAPASGSLAGRLGKNLYVFYNLILG
jgi:hypothetical protein